MSLSGCNTTRPAFDLADAATELPNELKAETDRLLAGRTRDIEISGSLLRLYLKRSWPQRSKVVRAWAIWIICLSFVVVVMYAFVSPRDLWLIAPIIGVFIPIITFGLFLLWLRPRHPRIEGLSVLLVLIGIIVAYGTVGLGAGGAASERYLNGSLSVATIGIVMFRVERGWSLAMGCCCPLVYLAFQLLNPNIEVDKAIASCLFYAMGLFSVVAARKNAETVFKKNFLMSLRNDYRNVELTRANRLLETLATRDPLTGLANRRSAADHIAKIWDDDAIPKATIAFVMVDIDHFKKLNDAAGHAAGDECLKRVARRIDTSVRSGNDVVCRYGGEEFLIVLTDVTQETAWKLAERIRSGVERLALTNPGLDPVTDAPGLVTISLGVAFAADGMDSELVAKRADDALYEAKRRGRNRVFMAIAPERALVAAEVDAPSILQGVRLTGRLAPKVL